MYVSIARNKYREEEPIEIERDKTITEQWMDPIGVDTDPEY